MDGPTASQVDAAVRAALAELGIVGRGSDGREFVFAERLLALRHAEALPSGVNEVRVAPGTVVTPLARDALKGRGIGIRLISRKDVEERSPAGEWGLAIEGGTGVVEALRRSLLDGPGAWREVARDAIGAARWVVGGDGRGAVVVPQEASLAVWKAHRIDGVRAANAGDADAVSRAVQHLGMNLLVIEPAGKSIASMKHLCETFRRGGAPRAPGGLDENRGGDRPGDPGAGTPELAERALADRVALADRGLDGRLGDSWRGGRPVR
jgi:hypothetical protein